MIRLLRIVLVAVFLGVLAAVVAIRLGVPATATEGVVGVVVGAICVLVYQLQRPRNRGNN
jgi:phosphate/sulfate permease